MTALLRVVIADDEPDMRDYLNRLLPRLGFEVAAVAGNGVDLLAAVRNTHPDLIITDVKMPAMDGEAAIHQIWAECSTPVVIVSAYERPTTLVRGAATGRCAYVNKPFKWTELEAAICTVLDRRTFGSGDRESE